MRGGGRDADWSALHGWMRSYNLKTCPNSSAGRAFGVCDSPVDCRDECEEEAGMPTGVRIHGWMRSYNLKTCPNSSAGRAFGVCDSPVDCRDECEEEAGMPTGVRSMDGCEAITLKLARIAQLVRALDC